MHSMISRVFSRREGPPASPQGISAVSSELFDGDIQNYYLRIIQDCLRRMLVPSDSIYLRVRRSGTSAQGLTSFAGYVRILKWDPVVMPVLLQNLPVVDARVRKMVDASVILEGTHFSGLWFQANNDAAGSPKSLVGLPCELVHHAGSLVSA